MKIRISHFASATCAFALALAYLLGTPVLIEAVESDPTKVYGADVTAFLYFLLHFGIIVWLYFAFMEAQYYILTEEGISACFLGITYRKVKWENIFDAMIGPHPLQRNGTRTLLLNCRPGIKYRPQSRVGISAYEKSLYKDLFHGQIICLRCGKKLDSVLMLLREHLAEDVMKQLQNR